MDDKDELWNALSEFSDLMKDAMKSYDIEADDKWKSLSKDEQLLMFYSVMKRLVQGELKDKKTYRGVLYDTFGFDQSSYMIGLECGFIDLHNSICDENELRKLRTKG